MTPQQIEAMKLALFALESCGEDEWHSDDDFGMVQIYNETMVNKAITALEEALAQPEQEPVELPCCGYTDASAIKWNSFNGVVQCHNCGQTYTPPQRTEQEPVAWMDSDGNVSDNNDHKCFPIPLYTTPPQRNPLTDEQRQELMSKAWNTWLSRKDDGRLFAWDFSFEVEAAHGIKEDT